MRISDLVASGAEIDALDDAGCTPLLTALAAGATDAARHLLASGADPDGRGSAGLRPLHRASIRGHLPVVDLLLASGARDGLRNTALFWAAVEGQGAAVERLHAAGASVAVRSRLGLTPLAAARRLGHREVEALLLRLGASSTGAG